MTKMYSTRDIALASVLITLGYELDRIDYQYEGSNRRPVGYFLFEETEDLMQVVHDFFKRKLAVEPDLFVYNMRKLKTQVVGTYKSPFNYQEQENSSKEI